MKNREERSIKMIEKYILSSFKRRSNLEKQRGEVHPLFGVL